MDASIFESDHAVADLVRSDVSDWPQNACITVKLHVRP
jgi:hypothetical protein